MATVALANESAEEPMPSRATGFFYARKRTQNLQHLLWDRENGLNRQLRRSQPTQLSYEREIHRCFPPNLSIIDVAKPQAFLRKFTPDGRKLLSFSHDQRGIEVYEYQSYVNAAPLLQEQTAEFISSYGHNCHSALRARQFIFDQLFKPSLSIRLSAGGFSRYQLNREFSIFLEDGRYVLLAGVAKCLDMYIPTDYLVKYPDLYDSCDILDFVIFLVNLETGRVCDAALFYRDCIVVSHNHGVSVYGATIAIMSRCRQCIDIYEIVQEKLVHLYTVGPLSTFEHSVSINAAPMLSCIKQRMLAWMYGRIMEIQCEFRRRISLGEFYRDFGMYESMIMVKMQLIDADNLLIRYEQRPPQTLPAQYDADYILYVFYSISNEQVLKIFPKDSADLLCMLRDYSDKFRNVHSLQTLRPSCSPSNDPYIRASFNKAVSNMSGGLSEAAKRFNITLPISTQSFSTSPFLDYSLYKYEDLLVSALERPKLIRVVPIRFSDRETNITKFNLHLELPYMEPATAAPPLTAETAKNSDLVSFIFHPYDPLIISLQRIKSHYVANIHIYCENTLVKK